MDQFGGLVKCGEDGKPLGFMGSSGSLHMLACSAYGRTITDGPETSGGNRDALVSIIFAAATLEAFVMEMQRAADLGRNASWSPPYLKVLADVLDEAERSRGSVRLRFLLAKQILPGKPYERGTQPFQDFDLLFQLRDAIVHMKPQDFSVEPHRLVVQLANRGLCSRGEPPMFESWVGLIETRAVARWACNVVPTMIDSLGDGLTTSDQLPAAFLGLSHADLSFGRIV